jgi:hypothetical protein
VEALERVLTQIGGPTPKVGLPPLRLSLLR